MTSKSEALAQGDPISENFVQSALDALLTHIAILDESGTIINVNTAWRRFAAENDYKGGFGLGENYLDVCDRATGRDATGAPRVAAGIRAVMDKRLPEFHTEYACHSPSEKRWFVMHVTRFEWNDRARYIIAHQSVTELKKIQIEFAASQKQLQAIFDNVNNGIITLTQDGRIATANPSAVSIFRYAEDAITTLVLNDLLGDPHKEIATPALIRVLEAATEHELIGIRRDGSAFPLYLAMSRVCMGNDILYTAILQDITERKRLEQELLEKERLVMALDKEREMNALKNRFISMMSHELRTPLSSILLASDLLARYEDKIPAEEKLLYINNIRTQVSYLTELIKDVSMVSRSDQQQQMFMPELSDVVGYCRDIVNEFKFMHQDTHTITFRSSRRTLDMLVDVKLLRQILSNLLTNAIKYSPKGSVIRVSLSQGMRWFRLQVVDEGIGIPEEALPHLFEPFHRAANTGHVAGTGLGMTIVKQSVELHDGTIDVESVVGEGTTVIVNIPITLGSAD